MQKSSENASEHFCARRGRGSGILRAYPLRTLRGSFCEGCTNDAGTTHLRAQKCSEAFSLDFVVELWLIFFAKKGEYLHDQFKGGKITL